MKSLNVNQILSHKFYFSYILLREVFSFQIRDALHKHVGNWSFGIRVGSPEEFQGDERKVIIVSTVRASAEHLKFDKRLQLGFLCNPKRFNVVVTRAQALLIIIGSPYLLKHDDNWGTLLKFASDNQCYKGCALEELPSEIIEDVYDTLRDVNIRKFLMHYIE